MASLTLATVPIAAATSPAASVAFSLGLPTVWGAWVAAGFPRRSRVYVAAILFGIGCGWLTTWLLASEWWGLIEAARIFLLVGFLLTAAWLAAPWSAWITARLQPDVVLDVAALTLVLSIAAVGILIGISPWLALPAALALMAGYFAVRGRLGLMVEHALFGGIRDQAAIAATEDERARLASEIHDGPLQELAAVITELDEQRQLKGATATLRGVASQLRGVTTALRPPVLDDLGLAAAVSWLVDQVRERAPHALAIEGAIDDRTSVRRADRPPSDVELAVFRIAQEALNNALRHSDASRVSVALVVASEDIALTVSDDGRGLDETATRAARRRGRLGLPSMRQRAASIGADLTIEGGTSDGTQVALRWKR